MRSVSFVVFASVLAIFSACGAASVDGDVSFESRPTGALPDDRQAVLVELFTSEGCSSCPPADKNLAFLERQQPVAKANIITLAFHVDYWDRLGWKDRFSSPLYSRRQEIYSQAFKLGSNYTPQMVVDGREEFVGNDSGKAAKEILKATETEKAVVQVTFVDGRLTARITNAPLHADATLYAAIAEDGISTRVERGENSGKTLEHVSVVRELKMLGMLAADKNEFDAAVDVQSPPDAKAENLKVVVFVQENESRRIIGVGRTAWKND
jgi:hypothetical protein